jgi:hypothetical protein
MISFDDGRALFRPCRFRRCEFVIFIDSDATTACGRSSSVAIDQNSSALEATTESADSPIENELPTYRAISARAVLSAICGGLAVCGFADPTFYVFSILAVGLGIWAHRAIRQHPDMLTGGGLASAGITLGLVFGLASLTVSTVQRFLWNRQAEAYGRKYADVLKSPSLGDVLWYNAHPDLRKAKTGAQLLEQHEAASTKQQRSMDSKMGPMAELTALRRRLASSNKEDVRFVKIENVGEDASTRDVLIYALGLYEVEGPGNKEFPEKHQYALAIFKARPQGRTYEWWTEAVRFPYVPKSYEAPTKPVDDGHGHAH